MKHKLFAVSALTLALAACDDNDVTAGTNNVEGTVEIAGIATSGIPFIGTELSANVADANGLESSTVIAYQWMSDGTAIASATGSTYVLTDAEDGAVITVSAAYTDNDGFDENVVSEETPIVTVAPVNDPATVTITGDTFSGSVLTAEISDTNGTEDISVTYVWRRDGVIDTGITSSTYTLLDTDIGSVFTVQVTFVDNIDANEDATSAETAVITAPLGDVTRVAQISDLMDGDTGELRIDEFGPLITGALRFRFSRDNLLSVNFPESNEPDPVTGETATPASFLGIFGTGTSATSSQNALIDLRMDNDGILSIRNADDQNGTQNIVIDETFEDGVFTEVLVTWDATNASVADGINPQVTVEIDGQPITDAPFDSPAFESTRTAGDATQGLANVVDGVATIQWRMGDTDEIVAGNFRIDDIVIYSDVAATTPVFSEDFEAIDIDTVLSPAVSLTGATIDGSTVDTVVTQFIEGEAATDSLGTVAITGPVIVGSNLTATVTDDNGVLSNAITYQWMREGVNIDGETASSYTLVDADLGQTITVTVNYTDVDGFVATDIVSPATAVIEAAPVIDPSAGISGLAAFVTDLTGDPTPAGDDTGELRIDLGDEDDAILDGSLSFVFQADEIISSDASGGNVGLTIYADSTSRDDSIVDVTFTNGGNINFINLVDATTGAAVPNISGGYTPNQETFVELTWVTDGIVAPAVTVSINGVQVASGISSGPVEGAANEDSNSEDNVNNGFVVFQVQVNENDTTTEDFALIDNIVITDNATGNDEVNVTFDDGTFAAGDVIDGGTAAFDSDPGTAISPFNNNSEDATIVDSSAFLTSNTISGLAASITDTTADTATDSSAGDTGEIRIDLGELTNAIQNGSASFVLNKDIITRVNVDGSAGTGNVGFAIFADDAQGIDAIVDVTFNNDESITIGNLDSGGNVADAYSLNTDTFVEVTWVTDGVVAPAVTVSIDGTEIANGTSTGTNDNTTDTEDNVSNGLIIFQIQLNENNSSSTDTALVDNIVITNEATGTNVIDIDFDDGTFAVDDVLGTPIFASNTQDATIVDTDAVVTP